MTLPLNQMINTGLKFFGQKIMLQSTGHDDVDAALAQLYRDDSVPSAPLAIQRADVQLVLAWNRGELEDTGVPVAEARAGQMGLFE